MKKHNSFGYALAALGVTLLGLIVAFVLITLLGSGYETLGGDSSELVDRTTEVLGVAEDSEVLNKKIKLGLMSPGDYIVSAMTGFDHDGPKPDTAFLGGCQSRNQQEKQSPKPRSEPSESHISHQWHVSC